MKYVLMQEKGNKGQIKIIDNNDKIGRGKVEKLVAEGFVNVGTIESDLRIPQLMSGFEYNKNRKLDKSDEKLGKIWDILRENY